MRNVLSSRFSISLLFACVFHAVILFGFVTPTSTPPALAERVLKITMATHPGAAAENVNTIAAFDQQGNGKESRRAALPQLSQPPTRAEVTESTPGILSRRSDASMNPQLERVKPKAQRQPLIPESPRAAASITRAADAPEDRIAAAADPRANYLEAWRKIVERTGNQRLPDGLAGLARGKRLTVEVTLDAKGKLITTRVRTSSGNKSLDAAALRILRDAAPFNPFPSELRAAYPRLTFAYDWRFVSR